jgi:four helix bundle protein
VEIAFGSLMECVSHIQIAQKQNMIDDVTHQSLYTTCEKLSRMLSGLRNSLLRK